MDEPFPVVAADQAVDAVTKQLSKATPALLVRDGGRIAGIVTRSDVLQFVMSR